MKLIVGLGNPGKEYNLNRHNVGVLFLHSFLNIESFEVNKHVYSSVLKMTDQEIFVARPLVFMNDSGRSVKAIVDYFKIDLNNVYIVHDDLDLKLGEYKIQKGVGPKLHNGISSIEEALHSKEFFRIRIGVDNRDPLNRIPGEAYVLEDFGVDELKQLSEVFKKIKNEKDIFNN